MSGGEFAEIEARAQRAQHARTEAEYARRYGVGVAESHLRAADASALDIPALLAAVRERDNIIARVRALHVRNQDGSWTCGDWECEKCTLDDGHHGPVCDTCSFSTDDDMVPSVVFWPCPTVQIIDGLPPPGVRAALDPQETP